MILVKLNISIIIYSELENAQKIFSNFWTIQNISKMQGFEKRR